MTAKALKVATILTAVTLALAAGCVSMTPEQQAQIDRNAAMPVTCQGSDDCEVKWGRALQWVLQNCEYRIQVQTDALIQTAGPTDSSPSAAFVISKVPLGGGKYEFVMRAGCDNFIGCVPTIRISRAAFAVTVMGKGA